MAIYNEGEFILNGQYRIERLIGEGASAQVYLARQVHVGNALVALKIFRSDVPGADIREIDEYRRRFQLEAQLMGKLRGKPRLLMVYAFDPALSPLALVMEYAPGKSLQDKLDAASGPLPIPGQTHQRFKGDR